MVYRVYVEKKKELAKEAADLCHEVRELLQIRSLTGVRIINRYSYDADVKCGSRVVDAKSVVGVLSLAKSKTVELILHTDECDALLEEIAPYAA